MRSMCSLSFRLKMSVQKGGMFGVQQKAQYSKETADLLKNMMQESKLTNYQQRVIKESMKGGSALPTRVNPHHSKDGPSYVKKKSTKIVQKPTGVKSLQTIEFEIANDTSEPYKPPVSNYNCQKEKERLNSILIYGTDKPLPKPKPVPIVAKPPKDRFDEIQEEIEERRIFMREMESLGQAEEHRQRIETEISQYIREMEIIDKKRNKELKNLKSEKPKLNDD